MTSYWQNDVHHNAAALWHSPTGPFSHHGNRLAPAGNSLFFAIKDLWSKGQETKKFWEIAFNTLDQMKAELAHPEPRFHFVILNNKREFQSITYEMFANKILAEVHFVDLSWHDGNNLKRMAWNVIDAFNQINFKQTYALSKEDVLCYLLKDRLCSSEKLSTQELHLLSDSLKTGERIISSKGRLGDVTSELEKAPLKSGHLEQLLIWRNDGLENLSVGWFLGRVVVTAAFLPLLGIWSTIEMVCFGAAYFFETARKALYTYNLPVDFDDSWQHTIILKNLFLEALTSTILSVSSLFLNFLPRPLLESEARLRQILTQATGIPLIKDSSEHACILLYQRRLGFKCKSVVRWGIRSTFSRSDDETKSLMKQKNPRIFPFLLFHLLLLKLDQTKGVGFDEGLSPEEWKKVQKIKNSQTFRDAKQRIERDANLNAEFQATMTSLSQWEKFNAESPDIAEDLKIVISPLKKLALTEISQERFHNPHSGYYLGRLPVIEAALSNCDQETLTLIEERNPKIFLYVTFKVFFELAFGNLLHVDLLTKQGSSALDALCFEYHLAKALARDFILLDIPAEKLKAFRTFETPEQLRGDFSRPEAYRAVRQNSKLSRRLNEILTSVATFSELDLSLEDPRLQELLRPILNLANENLSSNFIKNLDTDIFATSN